MGFLAASAHGANAQQVATLTPPSGRMAYICGVVFSAGAATATSTITCTITGLAGGATLYFSFQVPQGTQTSPGLFIEFSPNGLEGNAAGTAIVCTMPAAGSGNADQSVAAWGFSL